jgi:hypothetical protein
MIEFYAILIFPRLIIESLLGTPNSTMATKQEGCAKEWCAWHRIQSSRVKSTRDFQRCDDDRKK